MFKQTNKQTNKHYTCMSGLRGHSSKMALLSLSHTVTGSGTSPGSSGTQCWPMSLETDCGPHRVDNADRLHTQTVCFLAGMISCERRCQSCSDHGRNPFHWHQLRRKAEPPSDSAGYCHWHRSFHSMSHSLALRSPFRFWKKHTHRGVCLAY